MPVRGPAHQEKSGESYHDIGRRRAFQPEPWQQNTQKAQQQCGVDQFDREGLTCMARRHQQWLEAVADKIDWCGYAEQHERKAVAEGMRGTERVGRGGTRRTTERKTISTQR